MLFQDKVVIITGAACPVGRSCAELFAANGACLILADINENIGERFVKDLQMEGYQARFFLCDISQKLDVKNLLAYAMETYGRVDVLINNVSVADESNFLDLTTDDFEHVIDTNLKGYFLTGQTLARQMVAQVQEGFSPGSIIHISSSNKTSHNSSHIAYTTSKGAVRQLTKAMALALAPFGIRVNSIAPGQVSGSVIMRTTKSSTNPLGRAAEPAEIADIVVFLASQAASYITGQTIYADGGRFAASEIIEKPEKH